MICWRRRSQPDQASTVKAVRVYANGGPEVLKLEEVPTPHPGPGQALVRIAAAGVNFIEVYQRTGLYPLTFPFVPGNEAAGTVEQVGAEVSRVKPGDRVASTNFAGAYAEFALAPASRLIVLPDPVPERVAAAVLLQGMTAHFLTHSTHPLSSTDTCLVHAAAGGVGLLLCQMARSRGARVIGTVSTEQKAAIARAAGANEIILYTQQDFVAETKRLTGGAGVQVVYDSVGQTTFLKSLDCLAPRGMLVLYGQSSGPVEPVDPQILNRKGSLFLTRPTLTHYIANQAELHQRADAVLGWVAEKKLDVRIDREFPLAASAEAHRELESRRTTGKLLLTP
jgi:NADPH:quinone reductase